MALYIPMLALLGLMEVTKKVVPVFFVLIVLANYFNLVGVSYMLRNSPSLRGRRLRDSTKAYFFWMSIVYALVILLACIP